MDHQIPTTIGNGLFVPNEVVNEQECANFSPGCDSIAAFGVGGADHFWNEESELTALSAVSHLERTDLVIHLPAQNRLIGACHRRKLSPGDAVECDCHGAMCPVVRVFRDTA